MVGVVQRSDSVYSMRISGVIVEGNEIREVVVQQLYNICVPEFCSDSSVHEGGRTKRVFVLRLLEGNLQHGYTRILLRTETVHGKEPPVRQQP